MKTYSALFAEGVPYYGTEEIAAVDAAGLEVAKADDFSGIATDAEWENRGCRRIIHIEDPDGKILHQDVPLDDCFMRYGRANERRPCDAAPGLLAVAKFALQYLDGEEYFRATAIITAAEGAPMGRQQRGGSARLRDSLEITNQTD